MSGTTVYYNGVCLQDCLTKDFEHVIEYDESGYQAIANRFRITIESTITSYHSASTETERVEDYHGSTVATVSDLTPSTSSVKLLGVDTLAEVESLLSQNCMDFVMTIHEASIDADANTPKGYFQRNGSNRIILAATGVAKRAVGGTGENYLTVYDPLLSIDGVTEIDIRRHDVLDCDNGPKPIRVAIDQMTGPRVFRVSITFEICRPIYSLWNTDAESLTYDPRKAKGVMKNRWSVTDSMDDKGAVTHRIRGSLCVSDIRYKPNAMRLMAFPLAFPFAKLASRENEVSDDGKTLGYAITYTHAGNAPPLGVRDYNCSYTEEASLGLKGGYFGAIQIKVRGWYHRSTDNPAVRVTDQQQKQMLLRGAVTILYSRIRGINTLWNPLPGQNPVTVILSQFRVVENTKEPELDLFCAVQFTDIDGDRKEFPARLKNLGAPISIAGYDPKWWPIDNEWGRLLNEDVNNVFLRSAWIPKSAEGTAADFDYMNQQRHKSGAWAYMTPRITQLPTVPDDAREDNAGGALRSSPTSGSTSEVPAAVSPDVVPVTPNPIPFSTAFSAYLSQDLKGDTVLASLPPRPAYPYFQTGVAPVQQSGFSYLSWSSETLNDTSSGMIQLPLSKPRNTPRGSLGFTPSSTEMVTAKQTSAVVRLHAGSAKRIYSIVAERIGDWPEMPKPSPTIVRKIVSMVTPEPDPEASPGDPPPDPVPLHEITNIERLLSFEFLPDSHDIEGVDGCTKKFVINARYVYALDQPIGATEQQNGIAGGSIFSTSIDFTKLDFIPVVKNPMLKTTFDESGIRKTNTVFVLGSIENIVP